MSKKRYMQRWRQSELSVDKPGFRYREKSFAILMLNAWELLLKARIVKENRNGIKSIEIWEPRQTKSGAPTKRLIPGKTARATR